MTEEALHRENEELRRRLAEAEDTLSAIRSGQVDAIVLEDPAGTQIFSLSGAETVYRLTIETMAEAAINVTVDGTIMFCNPRFSELVATPMERLLGRDVGRFVAPEQLEDFRILLCRCCIRSVRQRVVFCAPSGTRTPALLSGTPLRQGSDVSLCLVAADLTELEAVADQLDQLREREHQLQREIVDHREGEEQLLLADRRKSEFLATLAHELRNPLAPIRTGLDLLAALRGDAVACEKPLQIMDRQLTHLVQLVDDLLDVSRISRGKIELRRERLDLAEIVAAAMEMVQDAAVRGRRELSVSLPSTPLAVQGDRVRLVQTLSNLLNNAIKFTEAGGHIEVRVAPRGERVEIQVEDDGRGVEPERLDGIFEMFSQAEPGRGVGLGIGLSLVRSLVVLHGGSVSVASAGRGCGATFTVSLPLCEEMPQPLAERQTPARGHLAQSRVLVVDDNRDIAEGLRLLLATLDVEVRVAHDGHGALSACAEWSPTHVLMDLGMPGMDGYETARRLCADHPDRNFRLIAVTGWCQEEDRRRTREAGFDEHLVKPVGVSALKAVLGG